MPHEEKRYTAEFKREVARKALDQSKKNLDKLSNQYDVPVSVILMWATELEKGGEDVFEPKEEKQDDALEDENVEVEITDEKVADSVEHGVMLDQLNYKSLIFWSVFGVILVVVFVQGLKEMYQTYDQSNRNRISSESQYYQVSQLEQQAEQQLNSFGVVDLENNIYRIPIDSVINDMAVDKQE